MFSETFFLELIIIYCTRPNIHSFLYSRAPRKARASRRELLLEIHRKMIIAKLELPAAINDKVSVLKNYRDEGEAIGTASENSVSHPPRPTFTMYGHDLLDVD